MALIKVVRDKPEVPGGNTYAYVSEESLPEVLENGWTKAKEEETKGKKTEAKVEEPKAEEVKAEVKEEPKKAHKKL